MVKLATIVVCCFLMYRLIFPAKKLPTTTEEDKEAKVIDIDYEEFE